MERDYVSMKDYVSIEVATKASDWRCTGGVNAGSDSYRVYESESVKQVVMVSDKNEGYYLRILRDDSPLTPSR